ncbi:sensor histidine kinase [Streptomyces halstedii]|uniref:histidine kinase n=2 Tax=Streptomyces halstedii TaxID=1944 RepID=A0A6N9U2D1_STRHA|nr:histidine kinase [Streptomyces halstedii]NEA16193.1 sensor histidine kinase [Streptomyces halstedii]
MWPAGRIVGESVLSLLLMLVAVGFGLLGDRGAVETAGVALGVGLLSLLRRVLPAAVLLVTVAGSVVFPGAGPLVLIAAWSAGRRIGGLGRAAGVFALAYGLSLGLSVVWERALLSPSLLVFSGLWLLVSLIVPGLAGRYWSQRRTLADTLHEYHAQLVRERVMVAGHARIRERQRIAQDMHDSLGHQLALIAVHTGALEVDQELTGRQREAVGVLRQASVAAMHELRDVVGVLRDGTEVPGPDGAGPDPETGGEDPGTPSRGVAGIDSLVEISRRAGVAVELRRSGEVRPLAPAADHAAYRVVQEGLTNAHKHAPGASITVGLRYEEDSVVVEVTNCPAAEPVPGSVANGGQGLTGLEERARLVGGMVHAGRTADGGFRLAGVLPYTSPARAHATFVAAPNDFRAQNCAGSFGEIDPVIDGNGLPKELAKAMSRNMRGSGVVIGCGVVALIVVLLVAGLIVGGVFLFREADEAMIEPERYDAVTVGQSEAEVRRQLPAGESFLTSGVEKGAPPVPEGARCLTLLSTEFGSSWDTEPVFRFCFKDGELVEKESFEVES